MNNKPKFTKRIAIGLGILVGIVAIVFGYNLVQNSITRAEDTVPHDVLVTEITQNSVKIIWGTSQETQGVVEYGPSPTNLNFFAPESQKSTEHSADLTLLSPSTTYYFQIRIADSKYDNAGVPWTFTTKSADNTQNTSTVEESPTPAPTNSLPAASTPASTCNEIDCDKIREKFFQGCDTQDYVKCIKRKAAASQ